MQNPRLRRCQPVWVSHATTWTASLVLTVLHLCCAQAAEWVQAGVNTNQPLWGLRGGLQFAVHPGGFGGGDGGPRGLIRLGYPTLTNGGYDLINFLALEPVVAGRRGFSELERSQTDSRPGKRFLTVTSWQATPGTNHTLLPGVRTVLSNGVERLEVALHVEPFENGAHVALVLSQRSDAPDELTVQVHALPDSRPIQQCIVTATMGNKARARQLWLSDGVVSSLDVFGTHRGPDFTGHAFFPAPRFLLLSSDGWLVAITTDEAAPDAVFPFPGSRSWYYGGQPVTQYWRKPPGSSVADLRVAVNGRYTYWMSRQPIPGGVAFENFELVQPFTEGQEVVFGITRRTPAELGFKTNAPAAR